jgi:hypothetical protein
LFVENRGAFIPAFVLTPDWLSGGNAARSAPPQIGWTRGVSR